METKRERQREQLAQICVNIGGKRSLVAQQLRAINRRVEKQKRAQRKHGEKA